MAANFVQVPTDGAGKKVQTFQNTINTQVVEATAVTLVNSSGVAIDAPAAEVASPVCGSVEHDSADAGSPVKIGGKAVTSLPTAVTANDRVNAYFNEYGEQVVLSGEHTVTVSQTPTISAASIYAAGDAVGGKLTFTGVSRKSGGGGVVESLVLVDFAQEQAATDLVLFNQDITPTADNSPYDPSDADLGNCIGVIPIVAGDYNNFVDNAVATVRNVGLRFKTSGTTNLYGQMVTRGTPNYDAASDLKVILIIKQD